MGQVSDVRERIGVEQQKIGQLAFFDGPQGRPMSVLGERPLSMPQFQLGNFF
jgi:hypothetical protein